MSPLTAISPAVIDAHHHLWRYSAAEYDWIDDSMTSIRRDFLPSDLVGELTSSGVDGAVAVQARHSLEETRWLLKLARDFVKIRGVVGWAPIASTDFEASLSEFTTEPKLVGL